MANSSQDIWPFCGELFWDAPLLQIEPKLTQCFQHTVCVWVPSLLLWICTPILLHLSARVRVKPLVWTPWLILKLILSLALMVITGAQLISGVIQWISAVNPIAPVSIVYPVILFVSMANLFVLTLLCQRRGVLTSGVIYLSLLAYAVFGLPELYYWISEVAQNNLRNRNFAMITFFVFYALVLAELVLHSFANRRVHDPEEEVHEMDSPELKSSFLSQLTYFWFTPIVMKGYKKPLTPADLWNVNKHDSTKVLVPKWEARWNALLTSFLAKRQLFRASESEIVQQKSVTEKTPLLPEKDGKKASGQEVPGSYTYSKLFKKKEEKQKNKGPKPPSMLWQLFLLNKWLIITGFFISLTNTIIQFASPQLLNLILGFIQDTSAPLWHGILYAALMYLVAVVRSLLTGQFFIRIVRISVNVRSYLTSALFHKTLKLSNSIRKEKTVGEIVNLMTLDINRFQTITAIGNLYVLLPVSLVLSLFFLWQILGYAVLAGVLVMAIVFPLNFFLSKQMRTLQLAQMKNKDSRMKLMNEILNGMKVLKLYAWELSMERLVENIRYKEIRIIRNFAYLNVIQNTIYQSMPFLVAIAAFATYTLTDPSHILTPQVAFVSLTLFQMLRFPLTMLSMLIAFTIQMMVSNKRLKDFLTGDEMDHQVIDRTMKSQENAVSIKDASFTWDLNSEMGATLSDINLDVGKKKLIAVVGQVGCGKSSLLSAMLGEMEKLSGYVGVDGTISYVPQQAWIQNMTLRDNILFGKELEEDKYEKVLETCALNHDLDILPAGDSTEIGEKGINLSGGQRARISLARAVYFDTDIYLLDDPLSAVDSHVGKHIFEQVLGPEGILKNKTRILVTHGLTYLKHVDHIVVIKDGHITERGNYSELMKQKGAFADILEEYLMQEAEQGAAEGEEAEEIEEVLAELQKFDPSRAARLERQISRITTSSHSGSSAGGGSGSGRRKSRSHSSHTPSRERTTSRRTSVKPVEVAEPKPKRPVVAHKLMEDERAETGRVQWSVYITFLKALGFTIMGIWLMVYVLSTVMNVGSSFWLADWSDANTKSTPDPKPLALRLAIYAILGVGGAVTLGVASIVWTNGMVRSSKLMHSRLLHNIMRSPMAFFDVTPLGRILNRCGKDIDVVDETLPYTVQSWVTCIMQIISTLVIIIIVTPVFAVVIIPIGIIYIFILRFYISTSRQLRRLTSVSRSPLISHFQETITGASSIRAYGVQQRFISESERRVDYNNKCIYPSTISSRWLAVYLDNIGNSVVLFAALAAVLLRNTTAGTVGLSLSYASSITQFLNAAINSTSQLETDIVSVERIKEYQDTPTEADWESAPRNRPPANWPDKGAVEFKKYATRYREGLELVIKDISAKILPEEKVGIVGRTGAGKSSLTLALFRLIEPAEGQILVDGVDIANLGLHDVRSKLTIIPQEPVLFSGALRMNLDPFEAHSDADLWRALERSHLKDFVQNLPSRLDHPISEGGENLSVGQRQLLCLARALLRKTRVLILDEATAAVDMETDALVQKTIRQEFAHCTILTIAHRINTILDSDRVIVLAEGKIIEFDSPQTLLADKNSSFYSMAQNAGLIS